MRGQFADERVGWQVAGLSDVDGDGYPDAGAPTYGNLVRIYGGPDGHLIRQHYGPTFTRPWVAGVGDLDVDGRADYTIGWPQESTVATWAGCVTVYSGASGTAIREVYGPGFRYHLGTSVAGVGDLDRDGLPDYAAGAPGMVCLTPCGEGIPLYAMAVASE
jgi:hypothetical protein